MKAVKSLKKVDWTKYAPYPVIGVDEVGRGCLAGPVVACAVILEPGTKGIFSDSKTISEIRREELSQIITNKFKWSIGIASVEEIDKINILRASLLAMRRAVEGLKVKTGHILVDGKFVIPDLKGFTQTALIKGDQRAQPISAASIVAKVFRDRLMKELHVSFPQYQFHENKGYGTKSHLKALRETGHTQHHRTTFKGVLSGEASRD